MNDFEGSVIENSGTLTWTDGNLTTDADGGITNKDGALFADKTTGTVTIGSAAATFENCGTYRKSGSGPTTVTQTFNNYSPTTLEVSDGIFTISGGGTNINGAVMRATHSGLIKFTNTAYTIVNAANLEVGNSSNENSLNETHFFTPPGSSAVNYGYELAGSTLTLGSIDGSALGVALYLVGLPKLDHLNS